MIKYVTRRAEDKKWCVKNAKADKPTRVFETQKAAIEYSKSLKSTTAIMVQSKEGKFRKVSLSLGATTTVKKPVAKKPSTTKTTTVKKPVAKKASTTKTTTVKKPVAKKASTTKTTTVKKPVAKKASTTKTTTVKKPVAKKTTTSMSENQKAKIISDLKAQNKKLDEELTKQNKVQKEKVTVQEGRKTNWLLVFAFVFLLAVLTFGTLLVLDWRGMIDFMNIIK